MRVLICGMIRSGSTFSFNAAREILSESGRVSTSTEDSFDEWVDESSFEHFISKSHVPNPQVTDEIRKGIVKAICTIRRPEDAIVSFQRAFGTGIEHSIQHVSDWLQWYSSIHSHLLTIDFDAIEAAPVSAVLKIDEFLSGRGDPDRAARIAAAYEKAALKERLDALQEGVHTINIGFSYYDKVSFFHRRHISSVVSCSAAELISGEELSRIRDALKKFADSSGNLRPVSAMSAEETNRESAAGVPFSGSALAFGAG